MENTALFSPTQASGVALKVLDEVLSKAPRGTRAVDPLRSSHLLAFRVKDSVMPLDVVSRISSGLPGRSVRIAQGWLRLSNKDMAAALAREEKTIRQWSERAALTAGASEQILRLLKVFFVACAVLEDQDEARAWLKEPSEPLGGKTPLNLLATAEGETLVINELMQMEYAHPV